MPKGWIAPQCPRCKGMLMPDTGSDEFVCFQCSRRFTLDGSSTQNHAEPRARRDERIAGMRF